ncbi:hypothetical protein CANMA_000283 [Candida margitis]|uniref:uncharacterized protein n=1 Tax=Candida margitis TaxID=1775924 RepID=UPI0022274AA8|nr:uncharacterized protein CANMA_000283 [Candida margitis]KAI5970692.1 hypothetical protein CANMA_000283 [Candida margitis]
MSSSGGKLVVGGVAIIASWWFGVNFWKPLILEQLDKDGNLKDKYKSEIPKDEVASWSDLKQKWAAVVDPKSNFSSQDKASLEDLKEHLSENKPRDR